MIFVKEIYDVLGHGTIKQCCIMNLSRTQFPTINALLSGPQCMQDIGPAMNLNFV